MAILTPSQPELWYDTWEDALKAVLVGVYGKGWSQKAAAGMWPTKDCIDGAKYLEKALNPERGEKLAASEYAWILKLGREHGYHDGMFFIADEASYKRPDPITPEERKAVLQEESTLLLGRLEAVVAEMRKLSS